MMVSVLLGLLLTIPVAPGASESMTTDLEALYRSGIPFDTFYEQAEGRRERWVRNWNGAQVPDDLLKRARKLDGPLYLLAIAVDGCSDSVNTIPHLARLVQDVDNLEMRIIDPDAGRVLMQSHTTPDGRPATPTVLVLDERFEKIGAFVERPVPLQEWALEHKDGMSSGDFLQAKFDWYDADAGRSTIEEVLAIMEFEAVSSLLGGSFEDDYGIAYRIHAERWTQLPESVYHIVEWNIAERYAIARNAVDSSVDASSGERSPATWTRIDWMTFEDMAPWTWGFCLTIWDAPSAEAARAADPSDRNTPRTGCGGHPFSRMKSTDR